MVPKPPPILPLPPIPPAPADPIGAAPTANTAFLDAFAQGPIGKLVLVSSFADFGAHFGGLDPTSETSYQILQFFLNGGQNAIVLRLAPAANSAQWQPGEFAAALVAALNPLPLHCGPTLP